MVALQGFRNYRQSPLNDERLSPLHPSAVRWERERVGEFFLKEREKSRFTLSLLAAANLTCSHLAPPLCPSIQTPTSTESGLITENLTSLT
jgi:hypothetical protein